MTGGTRTRGAPASGDPCAGRLEHAPGNVLGDPGEIARFYDRCSPLMRELLDGLAAVPDQPRPLPDIETAIGWPRRRIASVLGGVCHLRQTEFAGRRPYHFRDERQSDSGRWELWADSGQAAALAAARAEALTPARRAAARADRARRSARPAGPA